MKHIHFPTLVLHALNILLAFFTIHDYPGAFLTVGGLLLFIHVIWCCISTRKLTLSHLLGCSIQALFFTVFDVNSGAFGLGGGEFALLFYLIVLAGSAVIELGVGIYKYFRQ